MTVFGLGQNLRRCVVRQATKLQTSIRMKSNKCGSNVETKCKKAPNNFPCGVPEGMVVRKPKQNVDKPKSDRPPSMWLNPFCEEDDPFCPFNPRFDDIYYVESDKAKRKYWQTWVSCPPLQIKKKKICCFEKVKAAPPRRRSSKKPKTACPQPVDCSFAERLDCPRLKRRCHKAGRANPECVKTKKPLICAKPLTPYPAFSECVRMKPNALPLSECICWKKPMLCELWAEWRRRAMMKKQRTN